jgi:hypothetical protein
LFKPWLGFLGSGVFLQGRNCVYDFFEEIIHSLVVEKFICSSIFKYIDWYCRFLSPLSVVPLVTLTGLGLFVLWFPRVHTLPLLWLFVLNNFHIMITCLTNILFVFPLIHVVGWLCWNWSPCIGHSGHLIPSMLLCFCSFEIFV